MSAQEVIKSKGFKIAAIVIGVVLIALLGFGLGMAVGMHKAKFSYKFGENYERNFIGGRFQSPMGIPPARRDGGFMEKMMRNFEGRGFRNGHGVGGTIISIANNQIILKDRNDQENTVTVSDKTLIKQGVNTISLNDLKNGERIVVVGHPQDDGTISADLIRVFDNSALGGNNDNATGQ